MKKVAKNGQKDKAIALLFCQFCAPFSTTKKVAKMDEKLRL
jgi:hypothetical protein